MKVIEITAIWCPSCLVMRPIYEKIYEKYNLDVTKLDYDTDDIKEYNVGNILPVLIINDKRFIGEVKMKEIENYLENL
jgi:thiol-disulfide isomerase/thioredoxin